MGGVSALVRFGAGELGMGVVGGTCAIAVGLLVVGGTLSLGSNGFYAVGLHCIGFLCGIDVGLCIHACVFIKV